MGWEIEVGGEFEHGTLRELEQRALSRLEPGASDAEVDDAVRLAIDEGCVHYATQLAAVLHYGHVGTAFEAAYEDLLADVAEAVGAGLGEDE